jgi:hypothetical protein
MDNLEEHFIESVKRGDFLQTVYASIREEGEAKRSIIQAITDLHNQERIDVISEFMRLSRKDVGREFFPLREVFGKLLPKLDAHSRKVMECVKHLTLEAGADMMAGALMLPFIDYCKTSELRAEAVLNMAAESNEESIDFITPAVIAGSHSDIEGFVKKAVHYSKSENILVSARAIYALGRINYSQNVLLITFAINAIDEALLAKESDCLNTAALQTIFSLYLQDTNVESMVLGLIDRILASPAEQVVHVASEILFHQKGKIPESVLDRLLAVLVNTLPKNQGTIDNIDYGLVSLLEKGEVDRFALFIETFFEKCDYQIPITTFDSCIRHILEKKEQILSKIITRWLLSKNVRLERCCLDILQDVSAKGSIIQVDQGLLGGAPGGTCLLLVKKACGWFFVRPVSAVSFICSLLEFAPENEVKPIADILSNPLSISYPNSIKEYLDGIYNLSSKKIKRIIKDLRKKQDRYHDDLSSIGDVKELWPSQAQREAYFRRENRLASESMEKGSKKSFFRRLAKESVLLYGNRCIYYVHHSPGGEGSRQEVSLQGFNYSIEVPALEILDPHRLNYLLMSWRLEGCRS